MKINLRHFLFLLLLFAISCASKQKTGQSSEKNQLSDDELLTLVQQQTFKYFWDAAEPNSGMGRERFHMDGVYPHDDKNVVTTGGSGFGIMGILVGMEREFITRKEGVERLQRIVDFLEMADRFHGAWSHWIFGETGKVKPFGKKDNGGDIVETAFLVQGLLCVRQYFKDGNEEEQKLAQKIDTLWKEVEWNWYTQGGKDTLYWHWSPTYGWEMDHEIQGYNECLIPYVLGASSPTYPLPPSTYHKCWARGGEINGETEKYGFVLNMKHNGALEYGGPLFWAHYSYLGLDPRKLRDKYSEYWTHNVSHVMIDYHYCVENPENYAGYGENCWGLTSSYSPKGYAGHKPGRDLGVIAPTAALSSFPYAPKECMQALRHFYYDLGDKLWGPYGFYDAFSETENWYPQKYLAIDQGPIVVMIENHRTGMLWELFMSCEEVQEGLAKLGFTY